MKFEACICRVIEHDSAMTATTLEITGGGGAQVPLAEAVEA
jgi:hypothetical protein